MAIPINIEDLLNKRKIESNRIEFKAGWNPVSIYHSICAFANDIDNLGDVYSAIHAVQEELNITGTAANEAGSTLTGAFDAVKANYQNFIGSMAIGEDIKEPLNGLINSISNFAFNNLIPMICQVIQALPGAIVQFITQGIPVLLSNLGNLVSSIADSIQKFASGITAEKVTIKNAVESAIINNGTVTLGENVIFKENEII